ncbi:MAG: hypothetical protein ABI409_06795 [Ramlibacter sp.]
MRKFLTFLVLIFLGATAQAQNVVSSFSSLQWSMETAYTPYSSCNRLILDASGDFVAGSSFVLSGFLDCATTGRVAALGNGFFRDAEAVTMRLRLPNGDQIFCNVLNQLSGQCRMQNSATADLGLVSIIFR